MRLSRKCFCPSKRAPAPRVLCTPNFELMLPRARAEPAREAEPKQRAKRRGSGEKGPGPLDSACSHFKKTQTFQFSQLPARTAVHKKSLCRTEIYDTGVG